MILESYILKEKKNDYFRREVFSLLSVTTQREIEMSRSYKKNPIIRDNGPRKQFYKRAANKIVRKYPDIQSGGFYRKIAYAYDICDWGSGPYTWGARINNDEWWSQTGQYIDYYKTFLMK